MSKKEATLQLQSWVIEKMRNMPRLKERFIYEFEISEGTWFRWLRENDPILLRYDMLTLISNYLNEDIENLTSGTL